MVCFRSLQRNKPGLDCACTLTTQRINTATRQVLFVMIPPHFAWIVFWAPVVLRLLPPLSAAAPRVSCRLIVISMTVDVFKKCCRERLSAGKNGVAAWCKRARPYRPGSDSRHYGTTVLGGLFTVSAPSRR